MSVELARIRTVRRYEPAMLRSLPFLPFLPLHPRHHAQSLSRCLATGNRLLVTRDFPLWSGLKEKSRVIGRESSSRGSNAFSYSTANLTAFPPT